MAADQLETWVKPTILGERHECYAVTEEHAGSDTDAIRATARRDGDGYVLNGEKWHVTSFNVADHIFFQAKLTEGSCVLPGAVHRRRGHAGRAARSTPEYSHTYRDEHAVVAFEDVRVPAENLVGQEGDGMRYTYAWFRYERLGDRRPVVRRRRAADRRGIQVRRRARGLRPGPDRVPGRDLAGRLARRAVGARLMTYRTAQEMDEGADLAAARALLDGQAVRVRDGQPRGGPDRPGLRRPRLHAGERGRAVFRELRVDRIWEGTSEISG